MKKPLEKAAPVRVLGEALRTESPNQLHAAFMGTCYFLEPQDLRAEKTAMEIKSSFDHKGQ